MTDQERFDAAVVRALPGLGAGLAAFAGLSFKEKYLERSLIEAVEATEPGSTGASTGGTRLQVPDWDREMGGFDVRLDLEGVGTEALVEAKVDAVDQVLWDLFKLAGGLSMPGIAAAYLVVARTRRSWPKGECADLFTPADRPVRRAARQMFSDWHRAWGWLLEGGSARPLSVPDQIETSLLGKVSASGFPGYEVRVVSVRLVPDAGRLSFDGDWPAEG